jgi:TetR/AcrR family transcriptional repressor of nem operon
LHQHGFNSTGVQEITDAAGVPKGSFYNHFDSKEEYGAEVLGRYWEQRASRALALLSDESRPPLDRLRAYVMARTSGESGGEFEKGCMIGNFAAELSGQSRIVRDRLATVFAAWTRMLASCIAEAQRSGAMPQALDPDTLAAFLIDAFEGAVLRAKVERNPAPLRRFREVVLNKLLA